MTYPDESTYPITEWLIDGVWTDLSSRVFGPEGGQIDITRGRQNEQGTISPTSAICQMNNRDRELSNKNPESAYYRKIPPGTRVRHRAGNGDNHAYMPYNTFDEITTTIRTTDKAALDITGDIEVRVDIKPHSWRPANHLMILASKYTQAGDQRSWLMYLDQAGLVHFGWSPDGTVAARIVSTSTVPIPALTGRLAIKATLDVNNGAAGNTVTFYTASSIDGTYTQLGAAVVKAGVTSIKSGTAAVVIGGGDDIAIVFSNGVTFGGNYYGMHVYNGIGGSRVANPNFEAWDFEDTAVADSHSNTWTLGGQARITSPRVRFWGELTSATQDADRSGNSKFIPTEAADVLQRLGSGRIAAHSPLYLNIVQKSGLLGYWPMEDDADSGIVASAVPGSFPGTPIGVTFGQNSNLPGAKQNAELSAQTSRISMRPKNGASTGTMCCIFFFKMGSSLPTPAHTTFVQLKTTGTARYISFLINTAGFRLDFNAPDFSVVATDSRGFGAGVVVMEEWIGMRLLLTQNGANVDWEWAWYQQGSGTFWGWSGSYAGTVGYPTSYGVSANGSSAFSGMKVAHFVVAEEDLGFASDDTTWSSVIEAYAGERAAARVDRVARAAGIHCEIVGEVDSSALLGAQPVDTPLNVLLDASRGDGGILSGLRDYYGLLFRTRQDLERHSDAQLTYGTHLSEVPKAIDEAESIVNVFTASRTGGSSALAEITDGPNGTAEPPEGQGYRPGGADFNVYTDDMLANLASLRARIGTQDQPRVPNLTVKLQRAAAHPSTVAGLAVAGLDIGRTVDVDSWPTYSFYDSCTFLVQGYREELRHFAWEVIFNVSPAIVYRTGTYDTPDQTYGPTRWGASRQTLNAGITSSATTLVSLGTARYITIPVWTSVSARYPLDIEIGGEVITLTQPPNTSTTPQTFDNCVRSVNGVVAPHDAGDRIQIHRPTHYGFSGE